MEMVSKKQGRSVEDLLLFVMVASSTYSLPNGFPVFTDERQRRIEATSLQREL